MSATRVLLTTNRQLHADMFRSALAAVQDLQVVGEATEVIDCLAQISAKRPDVWIHTWPEGPELRAVLSHIYAAHPRVMVVRVDPDESSGFAEMQVSSLEDLVRITRDAGELIPHG